MIISSTRALGAATLPLALALAACGGGGGGSPTPPTPTVDRIEPYDPGAGKSAAEATTQPAAAHTAHTVALGPLAPVGTPKSAAAGALGTALQIGEARTVADTASPAATAALLQWQGTARGTQAAALRFVAEGSRGVRLGVRVDALPQDAVLRFYGTSTSANDVVEVSAQQLHDTAERNAKAGTPDAQARTYWSPDFGGSETTLEIEIPATASPSAVKLAVPSLSHFTISPAEADGTARGLIKFARKVGESESCNIDVNCKPDYLAQSRSVARMVYVNAGNSYLCTGTLLNDAKSSGTPYFLSANHCISDQATASSLNTDWFYRSAACGSTEVSAATKRLTGGATLLYSAAATDVLFLRLNDAPPPGVVYAGSYFGGAPAAGTVLTGLHHPSGDLQKFSQGTAKGNASCTGDVGCKGDANGNFIGLQWQQGVTQQGSSGSSVFVQLGQQRYVTGQLLGGASSCANPTGADYYGRFDLSYGNAIKQWLNP